MRALPLFSAFFLISLLVTSSPALAKQAHTATSAIKLEVPEGLCALPDTALGLRIFNNLNAVQQTVGNTLLAAYLTCEDSALVVKGSMPIMTHYSLVATNTHHAPGPVARQSMINEVKASMPALNNRDALENATAPAQALLKGSALERLDMVDDKPLKVVGEDENGFYILNRSVRHMTNGSEQQVIGLFGITAMAGEPFFAYFYDTPPLPNSPSRLAAETIAYLAKLDALNRP